MIYPCLRPGDAVAVIAPAGPSAPERVALVEPLFARFGLRARLWPSCFARHPLHDFLAGDDALRLADLHGAFADPQARAVFCLRGGYGCTRLLEGIDTALLRAHPKPLVGYSDITALHGLLQREGLPSLHAPMPGSDLVVDDAEEDAAALFALLMQPLPAGHVFAPEPLPGAWHLPGRASGRLVGGNLSLIAALAGTPWALDTRGAILFLEDVSEALYRVDRLLTQLRHSGLLDAAAGFLLGSFTEDDDPTPVLREHFERLGKPVLAGWPAGHGRPNRPLPLGVRATLDAAAGSLTLEQSFLA
jgi:muramoyltetrapeptide carboxypeptidase